MQTRKETENTAFDEVLDAKGVSLIEVAAGAKVSPNTVTRIRRGLTVRHASVLAVAAFLGVTPSDIYPVKQIKGNR